MCLPENRYKRRKVSYPSICIIDKNIESSGLLLADPVEELLDLGVVGVVHLDSHRLASPLLRMSLCAYCWLTLISLAQSSRLARVLPVM